MSSFCGFISSRERNELLLRQVGLDLVTIRLHGSSGLECRHVFWTLARCKEVVRPQDGARDVVTGLTVTPDRRSAPANRFHTPVSFFIL